MYKWISRKLFGTENDRILKRIKPLVPIINDFESRVQPLTDDALRAKTAEFKEKLAQGATLDDLLPEAFAVVRETGRRVVNMRHFDVQMIGGTVLHRGKIAEMKTGEGKTLVATLPLYLNALTGKGVHLVTPNDYLSKVGAVWMGPIYHLLGMSVGIIQGQSPETGDIGGWEFFLAGRHLAGHSEGAVCLGESDIGECIRRIDVFRPFQIADAGPYILPSQFSDKGLAPYKERIGLDVFPVVLRQFLLGRAG